VDQVPHFLYSENYFNRRLVEIMILLVGNCAKKLCFGTVGIFGVCVCCVFFLNYVSPAVQKVVFRCFTSAYFRAGWYEWNEMFHLSDSISETFNI